MKLHMILPGDKKHREYETSVTDQHGCPPGTIMIPDDVWNRLESKLGGRQPLLALFDAAESDMRE